MYDALLVMFLLPGNYDIHYPVNACSVYLSQLPEGRRRIFENIALPDTRCGEVLIIML